MQKIAKYLYVSLGLFLVICGLFQIHGALAVESDWAMFNHDAAHSGFSAGSVPSNPVVVWTYPSPKVSSIDKYHQVGIQYAPSVADGYLYVDGGYGTGLSCLNASTGQLIWSNGLGQGFESPAVADGVVYRGTYGLVYAYNASTGNLIWNTNFMNKYGNQDTGGSPVVSDGELYIQGNEKLYALNADNGSLLWKYSSSGSCSVCPAVSGGLVFGVSDGDIFALKSLSGVKVWSFHLGNVLRSSPAVYSGVVYVGSDDSNLYALNAQTGKLLWNYSTGSRITATPAVSNGTVYFGSWDGAMYALDCATGAKIWSFKAGAEIASAGVIADGVLFFNCNDRKLYALNATTGELLWERLTISSSDKWALYDGDAYDNGFWAAPVIAEGKIYVGTVEGNILAFGEAPEGIQETASPNLWTGALIIATIIVTVLAVTLIYVGVRSKAHF